MLLKQHVNHCSIVSKHFRCVNIITASNTHEKTGDWVTESDVSWKRSRQSGDYQRVWSQHEQELVPL
jgi:hypothetical protein